MFDCNTVFSSEKNVFVVLAYFSTEKKNASFEFQRILKMLRS